MKNPKVGERVVAYQGTLRMVGNIVEIDEDKVLKVRDDNSFNQWFHAKQCRRPKPKRKPEVVEFETDWMPEFSRNIKAEIESPVYLPLGLGKKIFGKQCKVTVEII